MEDFHNKRNIRDANRGCALIKRLKFLLAESQEMMKHCMLRHITDNLMETIKILAKLLKLIKWLPGKFRRDNREGIEKFKEFFKTRTIPIPRRHTDSS